MRRIEEKLAEHVLNPHIHAVAAKPALKVRRSGDEAALPATGFPAFEEGLLSFLARGGGMLLKTKIQKIGSIEESIGARVGALYEKKGTVKERLQEAERQLESTAEKRERLRKELRRRKNKIKQSLKRAVEERDQVGSYV